MGEGKEMDSYPSSGYLRESEHNLNLNSVTGFFGYKFFYLLCHFRTLAIMALYNFLPLAAFSDFCLFLQSLCCAIHSLRLAMLAVRCFLLSNLPVLWVLNFPSLTSSLYVHTSEILKFEYVGFQNFGLSFILIRHWACSYGSMWNACNIQYPQK